MTSATRKDIDELYNAVLQLESVAECRSFFRDLLTQHEIDELAERWKIARMLTDGTPYAVIEQKTGASSRTIARINRWLKEGKGGYRMLIERMRADG